MNRKLFYTIRNFRICSRKYKRKVIEKLEINEMLINREIKGISTKICTKRK